MPPPAAEPEFIDVSFRLLSKTTGGKTYVHLIGKPEYDEDFKLIANPGTLNQASWRKRTLCVLGFGLFPIQDARVQYVCCVAHSEVKHFFDSNGKVKNLPEPNEVPMVNKNYNFQLVDFAFNHKLENVNTSRKCLRFYGINKSAVCKFLLQQLVGDDVAETVTLPTLNDDKITDQTWQSREFQKLIETNVLAIEFEDKTRVVRSKDLHAQLLDATERTATARELLRKITAVGSPCTASSARVVMASILVAAAKRSALVATLEERQKDVAKHAAHLRGRLEEEQAATHAAIVDGENSRPFGIANVGNTCFLAVSLQLLAAIPSLALSAASWVHRRECTLESCWYCELENAISTINSGECVYDPLTLRRTIERCVNSATLQALVNGGQQQDAHEFLSQLFEEDPFNVLATEIVGGILCASRTCRACDQVSENGGRDRGEVFKFLPLGTPDNILSVDAALHSFTRNENVDDWLCSLCSSRTGSTRRVLIDELHSTLLIQLKRSDALGNKLSHHVAFPMRLDINPFRTAQPVTAPAAAPMQLHGVVVHCGDSFRSGHYYAYRRVGTQWYQCNDAEVNQVCEADVLMAEAYLLLYVDADSRP